MQEFQMKPMGVGTIIDRTFRIYRANFVPMVLFALLVNGTANLIVSWMLYGVSAFAGGSVWETLYGTWRDGGNIMGVLGGLQEMADFYTGASGLDTLLTYAVALFITPFTVGGVTMITLAVCHNEETRGVPWFSRALGVWGKLIGTQFALAVMGLLLAIAAIIPIGFFTLLFAGAASGTTTVLLIIIISLILIAMIIIVGMLYALTFPAAILEGKYGFGAVGRSWRLGRRRVGKVIGVALLAMVIVGVLNSVLGMLAVFLPAILYQVFTVGVSALLLPVTLIAYTLLYLDIRMTVEGYDIELAAGEMDGGADAPYPSVTYSTDEPWADTGAGRRDGGADEAYEAYPSLTYTYSRDEASPNEETSLNDEASPNEEASLNEEER